LAAIRVPTLILHRTAEHVIDVEQARYARIFARCAAQVEAPLLTLMRHGRKNKHALVLLPVEAIASSRTATTAHIGFILL
jgi:hypothetical protein